MQRMLPLLLLSLLPSLCFAGIPGNSADVSRTIEVEMGDNMRFSPSQIKVEAGETIPIFC